jgi:hypothetical protein
MFFSRPVSRLSSRIARARAPRLLAIGVGCGGGLGGLLWGGVGLERVAAAMAPNAPLVHAELLKTLPVVALQVCARAKKQKEY